MTEKQQFKDQFVRFALQGLKKEIEQWKDKPQDVDETNPRTQQGLQLIAAASKGYLAGQIDANRPIQREALEFVIAILEQTNATGQLPAGFSSDTRNRLVVMIASLGLTMIGL